MSAGLKPGEDGRIRCAWSGSDPLYVRYHDEEWGRPVTNDRRLFEKLCLEGFQSGLSWLTILRKRENFRAGFAKFDPESVAAFGKRDVERLLGDAGIVRHRGKIESTINNAKRALAVQREFGSLARFFWAHEPPEDERPKTVDWPTLLTMATTPGSIRLSKALRGRGFSFVGPTTAYAFMQAMGLVNDHVEGCHVRKEIEAARKEFRRPRATTR